MKKKKFNVNLDSMPLKYTIVQNSKSLKILLQNTTPLKKTIVQFNEVNGRTSLKW